MYYKENIFLVNLMKLAFQLNFIFIPPISFLMFNTYLHICFLKHSFTAIINLILIINFLNINNVVIFLIPSIICNLF